MTDRETDAPAQFLARLQELHRELGIPGDYLDNPRLPLCVEPAQLVDIGPDYFQRPQRLLPAAHDAWVAMRQAARDEGIVLHLISAFRGIEYQRDLILKKLQSGHQLSDILRVVAAPGFSEHHTGRAIDLATDDCQILQEEFEKTIAYQWLEGRAGEFGFRLSYPRGNPHGISYEPWHWCYHDSL